jgi:hypothetical protein
VRVGVPSDYRSITSAEARTSIAARRIHLTAMVAAHRCGTCAEAAGERPETVWYEGSHLSFHWATTLWSWLRTVLQATLSAKPIALRGAITTEAA